ncbi:WD repeat domain phosphoinositide-interacting protein 3 [Chytridiales sp. JEL 0842]|nr:WD repeat domain phosphoinositide-interacting protein 3 [Chytridiales sp. JEL 0842]
MNLTPLPTRPHPSLLGIYFNQDSSCFTCGTSRGFRIFNTDPVIEKARREPRAVGWGAWGMGGGVSETGKAEGHAAEGEEEDEAEEEGMEGREEEGVLGQEERPQHVLLIGEDGEGESSLEAQLGRLGVDVGSSSFPMQGGTHQEVLGGVDKASGSGIPRDDEDGVGGGSAGRPHPDDFEPERAETEEEELQPDRPDLDTPGGIAIVEMLGRTNIVALVGGGRNPKFPKSSVVIWDDLKGRVVMEFKFKSEVKAVRLRREIMVVVLLNKVTVFSLQPPIKLYEFPTIPNDLGLVSLSSQPLTSIPPLNNQKITLAFPARKTGQVNICTLSLTQKTPPPISLIQAHSTALTILTLTLKGDLLATASTQGTLIRIWDTTTGRQVQELRRGMDRAKVYCVSFCSEGKKCVVTSDKGTVHVFYVKRDGSDGGGGGVVVGGEVPRGMKEQQKQQQQQQHGGRRRSSASSQGGYTDPFEFSHLSDSSDSDSEFTSVPHHPPSQPLPSSSSSSQNLQQNRNSSLSFFSPLNKYFASQWSFAQFTLPVECASIACFAVAERQGGGMEGLKAHLRTRNLGEGGRWTPKYTEDPNGVVVLTADGAAYKFSFDPRKGGEAKREGYVRFYKGLDGEVVVPHGLEEEVGVSVWGGGSGEGGW